MQSALCLTACQCLGPPASLPAPAAQSSTLLPSKHLTLPPWVVQKYPCSVMPPAASGSSWATARSIAASLSETTGQRVAQSSEPRWAARRSVGLSPLLCSARLAVCLSPLRWATGRQVQKLPLLMQLQQKKPPPLEPQ